MTSGKKLQLGILLVALSFSGWIIVAGVASSTSQSVAKDFSRFDAGGNVVLSNGLPGSGENSARQMLTYIDRQIAQQEDVKDVRCWSSVNKIQTFISGLPIDTQAIGQRVECYIELLDSFWMKCSTGDQTSSISASDLRRLLQTEFPAIVQIMDRAQLSEKIDEFDFNFTEIQQQCDAIEDYSDTIESWRLLQSWAQRKVLEPDKQNPKPFSNDALAELKRFLVAYDIELLKRARMVAMANKQARVNVDFMNQAFEFQWKGEAGQQ